MNRHDAFFYKVISNAKLVDALDKLKGNVWACLSFKQRKDIFISIFSEISEFYPDLGKPKFDFAILEENQSGEDSEEGTYLNVKMIEDGNYFEILAAFFHELRHFYQRKADLLYKNSGIVHELFNEEEIELFSENLSRSTFMSFDNYIQYNEINDIEYNLQPIEYDAEKFSFEFMKRFASRFLTDSIDLMNCDCANLEFKKTKKIHDGNDDDIVSFNKIYSFNYNDRVKENSVEMKIEKEKYKKYEYLLSKLHSLNVEEIFTLLNPGLLLSYDRDTVMNILNAYLKFNKSETRIIKEEEGYYYNGLLLEINELSIYKLIEPLFLQVAEERVKQICNKDFSELESDVEKDVKINLLKKNNFIKENEHPLLYRLQPYMLYRDMFIRNEYLKLIRGVDDPYDSYNSFFGDFVTYIKKYDYVQLMKKAEILFDKEFDEIYNVMLNKMKSNIELEKKAK